MSKPNHRIPTKQTPFASGNTGGNNNNNSSSRSHHQRMTMTTSIRKAKRGQTVARKRHMQLSASSTTTATNNVNNSNTNDNPYSRDGHHVKETVQLAQTIVHLCSMSNNNNTDINIEQQLIEALDRLCVLLTPDEKDVNPSSQQMNIMHGRSRHDDNDDQGVSYDSSMAGMAANAILSQFLNNNTIGSQGGNENLALALANALAYILSIQPSNSSNKDVKVKAVIVLNQLAATDPPPLQQNQQQLSFDESNMVLGGRVEMEIPTSWCHVIVNSNVLPSLLLQLPNTDDDINAVNHGDTNVNMVLCEKSVFVIGNLLGDSFTARQALLEMGAIPKLIASLKLVLNRVKLLLTSQQQNVDMLVVVLQLLRNSVWSLINFIRGEGTSSTIESEMKGVDLATLLSIPEVIQSIVNNRECIEASYDVAMETCWLVVFLSNLSNHNIEAVIGYWLTKDVLAGLVTRLSSGTNTTMMRFQQAGATAVVPESSAIFANNPELACQISNSSIRCCRALTNITIYVGEINDAQARQIVTSAILNEGTVQNLMDLISIGSIGGGSEASAIAQSASSLASLCLTNASQNFDSYSGSKVWSLLPSLVRGLIAPLSTFDFRREVVWAIWNMLQYNQLQDRLLVEILTSSQEDEVARSLTNMLTALESSDAVEPSLGLIDMLIRRLDQNNDFRSSTGRSLKILFEEVGLVDALWYVCDNDVDESEVAEKAAELLDDFYEEQEDDDDGHYDDMVSSNGQQFQFQAPSNTGQFNFG